MSENTFTVEFRDGTTQHIKADFVTTNDHVLSLNVWDTRTTYVSDFQAVAAFPREGIRGIYPQRPAPAINKITIQAPISTETSPDGKATSRRYSMEGK